MIRSFFPNWGIVILLSYSLLAQNPKNPSPGAKSAGKSESFLDKVLRVTGISSTPNTLKGPGDEVRRGEVWLVSLDSKGTRKISSAGGYRSPIFTADGDILALQGTTVVRLKSAGNSSASVGQIAGVSKLVGYNRADPERVLILREDDGGNTEVGLFSLRSGVTTDVPFDRNSDADRQMLEHLQGWTRVYDAETVYVGHRTRQAISGPISWSDVFVKSNDGPARDVSECGPINCGQPSLSADKHLLVFIKSDED